MTIPIRRSFFLVMFVGALAFTLHSRSASAGWYTSYDITLPAGFSDVTNILLLERDGLGSGSTTWAFTAGGNPSQPNTTTINNPFNHIFDPTQALLIGLTTSLPGDGSNPQQHVVLMMNNYAANLANHIAWGTLFRNTTEESVIADILLGTSGQDFPIVLPGIFALNDFAAGDGTTGILGPGGVPQTAWFSTNGSFSVMAFSDGTLIGTGVSTDTFVPEPAPEPGTLIIGLLGVGIAACYAKFRHAAASALITRI